MSKVKIVRGGQASFLYPQVGHETGEASAVCGYEEAVCEEGGEGGDGGGEFEGEMRGQKEKALWLQREGVIS